MDTGNAPNSTVPAYGLVDDDPTRFTVGQALQQPPVITTWVVGGLIARADHHRRNQQLRHRHHRQGDSDRPDFPPLARRPSSLAADGPALKLKLSDCSYSAVVQVQNAAGMVGPASGAFAITVSPPATPVPPPAAAAVIRNSQVFLAGTENAFRDHHHRHRARLQQHCARLHRDGSIGLELGLRRDARRRRLLLVGGSGRDHGRFRSVLPSPDARPSASQHRWPARADHPADLVAERRTTSRRSLAPPALSDQGPATSLVVYDGSTVDLHHHPGRRPTGVARRPPRSRTARTSSPQ